MSKERLELKVGLFVLTGLVLLAVLALSFTKGSSFLRGHYDIPLHATSVSGLKVRSQVLMSGFPVGTISAIDLSPAGKEAIITLRIYSHFEIYDDARFIIETSGLLGDQYVSIIPTENKGGKYPHGKPPIAKEPVNYGALASAVTDFVPKVNEAATNLNGAITDIRKNLFTERTLTNLAAAIENLRVTTEHASIAVDKINAALATNAPSVGQSVSNLLAFTEQLQAVGDQLKSLVATNTPQVTTAIKNIESSTEVLKSLLDDVQAGKGLAGTLVKNDQLAGDVAQIANNLSITTSNLNRLGLWGILWKKKAPPAPKPQPTAAAPKSTR